MAVNGSKLVCSFCGKDNTQVVKLIAGQNNSYICNDCVDVCNQVLISTKVGKAQPKFEIVEEHMFCVILQNFDDDTIRDMVSWLDENYIDTWKKENGKADTFKILFENESDLVAFKLRWI